jgi:hypothetical protein
MALHRIFTPGTCKPRRITFFHFGARGLNFEIAYLQPSKRDANGSEEQKYLRGLGYPSAKQLFCNNFSILLVIT